ncbi:uncharacterized protein F5147DRAFT_696869 [Suillus discolor]|uniref:Uncharacterized protein n=1 Tax=Suillus discolor TaxID=1912936 RepID=A0A9P7F5C4_9AGAM|nr:uncharacterized protein F5147DRAFT_696869 [Suillus discolor]KAG2107730.1 hypothetical protein F5147DRAFT_696869 [Suillus discolor]
MEENARKFQAWHKNLLPQAALLGVSPLLQAMHVLPVRSFGHRHLGGVFREEALVSGSSLRVMDLKPIWYAREAVGLVWFVVQGLGLV